MDSIWPFETAEYRELVEERERLLEVLEQWLTEATNYERLLRKEAKMAKGGRPTEADRKEKSADRAAQREAKRQRDDPHLAWVVKWSRAAAEAFAKAKREGGQ